MTRLLILSLTLSITTFLSAQTYVGIRGHMANTWLLNQNISDAGDELDYKGSYTGGLGLHGIKMLGPQSGVALSLGISRHEQQTQGTIGDFDFVNLVQVKYTDVALLYTYLSEGGLYLEVGPQFSLRNDNIDETFDFGGEDEHKESFTDPNLNSSTVFGVFGIGGMINLNDELRMMVGIQLGYGFTDLTNELTVAEYNDLDLDVTSSYTAVAQGYDSEFNPEDMTLSESIDYKSTNPAFGRFLLGLYYTIE